MIFEKFCHRHIEVQVIYRDCSSIQMINKYGQKKCLASLCSGYDILQKELAYEEDKLFTPRVLVNRDEYIFADSAILAA